MHYSEQKVTTYSQHIESSTYINTLLALRLGLVKPAERKGKAAVGMIWRKGRY